MTLNKFKSLVGDLARPYALIAVGTATARAIWTGADDGSITAAGIILIALYGARSLENYGQRREAAKVETAKAQGHG